jgi:hypothetical protein
VRGKNLSRLTKQTTEKAPQRTTSHLTHPSLNIANHYTGTPQPPIRLVPDTPGPKRSTSRTSRNLAWPTGEGCIARPMPSLKNEVRGYGVTGPSIDRLYLKLLLFLHLPVSEQAGLRLLHVLRRIDSVATWDMGVDLQGCMPVFRRSGKRARRTTVPTKQRNMRRMGCADCIGEVSRIHADGVTSMVRTVRSRFRWGPEALPHLNLKFLPWSQTL